MTPPRDYADFLDDILVASRKAIQFIQGMAYDAFVDDEKTSFAVVRALEIVGEAAKRIPAEVRDAHPAIPWRAMSGIRDKLIHDYTSVNLQIVWNSVVEDLPAIIPPIEQMIQELANEGTQ